MNFSLYFGQQHQTVGSCKRCCKRSCTKQESCKSSLQRKVLGTPLTVICSELYVNSFHWVYIFQCLWKMRTSLGSFTSDCNLYEYGTGHSVDFYFIGSEIKDIFFIFTGISYFNLLPVPIRNQGSRVGGATELVAVRGGGAPWVKKNIYYFCASLRNFPITIKPKRMP